MWHQISAPGAATGFGLCPAQLQLQYKCRYRNKYGNTNEQRAPCSFELKKSPSQIDKYSSVPSYKYKANSNKSNQRSKIKDTNLKTTANIST